jgi:hypothetical protein
LGVFDFILSIKPTIEAKTKITPIPINKTAVLFTLCLLGVYFYLFAAALKPANLIMRRFIKYINIYSLRGKHDYSRLSARQAG